MWSNEKGTVDYYEASMLGGYVLKKEILDGKAGRRPTKRVLDTATI